MKILFIVQAREGEEVKQVFVTQNEFLSKEEVGITYVTSEEQINEVVVATKEEYTHICLLPVNTKLNPSLFELLKVYYKDEESVLVPMVELVKGPDFQGFLNNCLWKPYLTAEYGELDLNLALQQMDLTLYSCIIPLKLIQENPLKPEIKYYSHNELINNLVSQGISFIGCQKVLAVCDYDYTLKEISNEEKIKFFNQAREAHKTLKTTEESVEV